MSFGGLPLNVPLWTSGVGLAFAWNRRRRSYGNMVSNSAVRGAKNRIKRPNPRFYCDAGGISRFGDLEKAQQMGNPGLDQPQHPL
jgi:hypothetical protein